MKRLALLTVSAAALLAQGGGEPSVSVTAVRHWSLAEVTRVAVEVTGPFTYKTDRLGSPDRVYYDIANSRPRIEGKRVFTEVLQDPLVPRVRVAETVPGVTRIVLELAPGSDVATSQLSNPSRLIVEVRRPKEGARGRAAESAAAPPVPTPAPTPAPVAPRAEPVAALRAPKLPAPTPVPTPTPTPAPVQKAEAAPVARSARAAATPKPTPVPMVIRDVRPKTVQPTPPRPPDVRLPAVARELPAALSGPPVSALSTVRTPQPERAAPTPEAAPRRAAVTEPPPPRALSLGAPETGLAAAKTSAGDNSLVRALGLKLGRVVIDPGHGGHDQGTQGPQGVLEKDVVLDVAKRLGKLIEGKMGAEVVFTREDDTFIPLEGRTAFANARRADLFLSIHANSAPVSKVAGVETFFLNITGSKDSLDVAARENASSQKSIFELADLIQKIAKQDKAEESKEFATKVQAAMWAFSARNIPNAKNRGVKSAPLVVLIGAHMPSVLAEIGFLSNPKEEALLRKPDYRQKVAEALFRGLQRYADGLSHFRDPAPGNRTLASVNGERP